MIATTDCIYAALGERVDVFISIMITMECSLYDQPVPSGRDGEMV